MTAIILLFTVGILLLAVEIIVPGGILGVAGAVMMIIGCVLSFTEYGTTGGMISIAAAVILSGIAIFLEFYVLPRTPIGKRAFLHREIDASSSAYGEQENELVGKPAEALTMLSPTGYIRVDGKRYEAFSQSGQVEVGTPLQVIGSDNFRLIVSLTKTN